MLISVIRTILLYILLTVAVRLMGKRQIGDLQTTELVVTLLISDIAVIPMQNTSVPLLSGLVPILILIVCEIVMSVIMLKNGKFRKLVCGSPVMVIENGKILQDKMKSLRMTTEDLCVQLRQQNVFCIDDVQYCIAETNGQLSVLQKPSKRTVCAEDLNIEGDDFGIEVVVISDGELLDNSVKLCGFGEDWIMQRLSENDIQINDVFIMTVNSKGEYNIIRKE